MLGRSNINHSSNSNDDVSKKFYELSKQATLAESNGDHLSAVNLYMAAYEVAKNSEEIVKDAVEGIKKAWNIVLAQKNRPLAEYVFDILCKHISEPEINTYSDQLHDLMLDKLKGLGVPIEHLQDTNSANDALNKMKDFISGMDDKKAPEPKQIQKPKEEKPTENKAAEKDAYYIRREINKYDNLVGFDTAIQSMRKSGVIGKENSERMQLVERLNKEHGLNRISFSETMIFTSPSRVDANLFMEATASEIGLPCIQMHMDDNVQGSSVLCMMAPADSNFRLNPSRTGFNGKGILMLEDVDTWNFPDAEDMPAEDGLAGFFSAQMSRGIAEVTNLIDVALDDPNILVMATVGDKVDEVEVRKNLGADNFTIVRIDNPTDRERAAIWAKLAQDHPSLRAFSTQKLVDYSKNMSRYDIEVAVHEALEDAYKLGMKKGEYIPLSIVNIVERLADHQPLDSSEYKKLEDVATADFKKELENIDDILK